MKTERSENDTPAPGKQYFPEQKFSNQNLVNKRGGLGKEEEHS